MSFGKISIDEPAKKGSSGCGIGCLSVIVIAILIGVATSLFSNSSSGENADELASVLAERACERAAETQLKAPSTAKFSDTHATGSGTTWTVSGSVDAENSFGAMMRNGFTCEVSVVNESATVKTVSVG